MNLSTAIKGYPMQAEQTVEGFTNYATFGVAVVLDNDQDAVNTLAYRYNAAVRNAPSDPNVKNGIWTVEQTIQYRFADAIKDTVERLNDDGIARTGNLAPLLSSQMAQAGLAEVNWAELADHWTPES